MGASPVDTAVLDPTGPLDLAASAGQIGRDASISHTFGVDRDSEERRIERLTS